jgi:hypothetical protein
MSKSKLAHIVSFLTLPLWIPLFISLNTKNTSDILWASASCIVLLTIVFLYKSTGLLTSLHMPTRAERLLPLATSIIIYMVFAVFCYFYAKSMYFVYLLAFIVVLGLYIISLWDKVSIHVAGATAGVCYINQFYSWDILSISTGILLILTVVWARLYLNAHTVKQIILGFLTGLVSYTVSLLAEFAK